MARAAASFRKSGAPPSTKLHKNGIKNPAFFFFRGTDAVFPEDRPALALL
jgi:hypothetical protein